MSIQTFIEKAIEGGYTFEKFYHGGIESVPEIYNNMMYFTWHTGDGEVDDREQLPIHVLLLDPEAWKAVGKVEGWEAMEQFMWNGKPLYWKGDNQHIYTPHLPLWHLKWHRMIDALAEGKSIEQFLETL